MGNMLGCNANTQLAIQDDTTTVNGEGLVIQHRQNGENRQNARVEILKIYQAIVHRRRIRGRYYGQAQLEALATNQCKGDRRRISLQLSHRQHVSVGRRNLIAKAVAGHSRAVSAPKTPLPRKVSTTGKHATVNFCGRPSRPFCGRSPPC